MLQELERTPVHSHGSPKLVVTIRGTSVRARTPKGGLLTEVFTEPGDVRSYPAGGEPHYIENAGTGPYVSIIVELLGGGA